MEKNSQNFSVDKAQELAKSPAAQQLMAMLQQENGSQLQKAMELISKGDVDSAGQIINRILSTNDQAKKLAGEVANGRYGK